MESVEIIERIPKKGMYDIIVAGGGVAGAAAALAAARAGRSVLLLEKSLMVGGLATLGLINFFEPICNGRGKKILTGLPEELMRLAIRWGYDSLPSGWRGGEPGPGSRVRCTTWFDPNLLSMVLLEQLLGEGIAVLLDTVVERPVMEGGRCGGVIGLNKSGRVFFEASVVIDATGDGDILARSGVPVVDGRNFLSYSALCVDIESCAKAARTKDIRHAFVTRSGGDADFYGKGQPEGAPLYVGISGESVTDYVVRNQRVLLDRLRDAPRKSRAVAVLPGMPQFRTVRRISGDYTLTVGDRFRHFPDSIAVIPDFNHRDDLYEVPLRCLCRKGFDNLLTAGRSVSAEGYAWDVVRVIPPAIATGQAAGLAAAHAIEEGRPVWDVDIHELQVSLEKANVMIHFNDL